MFIWVREAPPDQLRRFSVPLRGHGWVAIAEHTGLRSAGFKIITVDRSQWPPPNKIITARDNPSRMWEDNPRDGEPESLNELRS